MLGLFIAFYWPTREIRLVHEESQGKTEIAAGGISAKSQEGFQSEFERIMNALRKIR
jgi:hypothetical protein